MNIEYIRNLTAKLTHIVITLILAFALALGATSCDSSPSTGPDYENDNGDNDDDDNDEDEPAEVTMTASSFTPSELEVEVGTTVLWINTSAMGHTVTSGVPGEPDGLFDSGNMPPGAEFSYTFDEAGEFPYFCIPHQPQMTGIIIVAE